MGQTSELFLQMRQFEAFELTATKKSILENAESFTKIVKESGEITKEEFLAKSLRNASFWGEVSDISKKDFSEKTSFYGVEITPMNGKKMIQYQEDPIYKELEKQLKQREELLKTALNQSEPMYDSEGIEVPKVSVKYAKDSIQVKF